MIFYFSLIPPFSSIPLYTIPQFLIQTLPTGSKIAILGNVTIIFQPATA